MGALLGVAAALIWVGSAVGVPEPSVVSKSWELGFQFEAPRIISVQRPQDPRPRFYWYLTYAVINQTGDEQLFVPNVWMLTDAGDLLQANRHVPSRVFTRIKEVLRNPLLESPANVVGRLLQGNDNARDGVAIWPVPDHDINEVHIFFGGLSGETHQVVRITERGDTNLAVGTFPIETEVAKANAP